MDRSTALPGGESTSIQAAPPAAAEKSLPRNVKILGLASLLNDIASEAIVPRLPDFLLRVLGGNLFVLGIIEGVADSISSIVKLWSGGRSDQAGRRKDFVVFGYSLAVLSRPLIGMIAFPWQLFGLRVLDRIGKGVRTSPRDALIADSTNPAMRGRAFGFHRAMDHLGAAIGPLLAAGFLGLWPQLSAMVAGSEIGSLLEQGFFWLSPGPELRILFLLTVLPGLLVLALLVLGLKEPPPAEPPKEKLQLTLAPFDRNFRLYLLALVIFTLGNSTDMFLLVRAGELGVPVDLLPLLWCAFHVVKSTSNWLLGYAVDRFGPRPLIFLGWLVYSAIYLAFGVATTPEEAWGLFISYALFYGLTEPAEKTLVANLVGSERKGLAYGWFNCAIGVATLPSSIIFGALYHYFGALTAFGWGAALALLAVLLMMAVKTPAKSRSCARCQFS
jgi:MFS family permease